MKNTSIAKITRPRLQAVLPRKRLFGLLDKGRSSPLTWVSGPGGAGKTTLVASWLEARNLPCLWYQLDEGDGDLATFFYYLSLAAKKSAPRVKKPLPLLTPEYLQGIPTFTKRYFENLCSRLKPPFVIVFDNYHHIPAESAFHDMIRDALSVIPDGVQVMINSRGAPPSSLAMPAVYRKIHTVGWDDLKFDRGEIEGLFKSGQQTRPSEELLKRVEIMTTGWAAGLVLVLQRLGTPFPAARECEQFKPEEFFDYFASELFLKTDPETQNFLLKTSFLPRISPNVAAELTGNENAKKLLAELSQNHFFTERRSVSDPVYQYHPLFQEFLQAHARETFAREDLLKIQRRAAESLESSGQIEDAAELYRVSEAWDGLVRILLANAQAMMSQGRNRPLEAWLDSLPVLLLEQDPWLLYWKGACTMPSHLAESHGYFERALTLFSKKNDAAGVFRSWSGAIESLVQDMGDIKRLDRWVALVLDLMKQYDFPFKEIEDEVTARIFTAMPWDPAEPGFVKWRKQATGLIESDADPNLRLMTAFYLLAHHLWIGEYATGRIALDVIRRLAKTYENISPLAYCMGRMCEGWFVWLSGGHRQCYSIMQEALERADESGVHIWDKNILALGAAAKLCMGDITEAGRLLERMAVGLERARLFDRFYYHLTTAWRYMTLVDIPLALTHQNQAQDLAIKTGFPINASEASFGMAIIRNARGEHKKAKEHAAELHRIASRMGSALIKYKAHIVDAVLAFEVADREAGLRSLRDALTLGRERGFVYFTWWIPGMMTGLFMKALEAGIEPEYVKNIVRKCNLLPKEPPLHIENWPWPVKICTLGGFKLVIEDKPIEFTGKVQKKPIEMLKALIAFGGDEVSEDRIIDALWPDADGDTARISFKTTLHRLRQLFGKDELIQLQDGRVSLDRRLFWVDAWAFERMLEESPRHPVTRSLDRYFLEKALHLYRGHFLSGDGDKPWVTSMQERLRSKYLRAVNSLGHYWLEQSQLKNNGRSQSAACNPKSAINNAVGCFEKGLEIDDVAEEFYQNLMLCYHKLGRKAEAVKVYKRCCDTLMLSLGVEPSEETEMIYRKIVGK